MHATWCFWLLLLVAACSGRQIHRPPHATQQMLLIELPEQRDAETEEAAEPSKTSHTEMAEAAEPSKMSDATPADDPGQHQKAEAEETLPAEDARDEAEDGEVESGEERDEQAEQRPPRIVKRQCYGCAEVVCSCPDCSRR